MDHNDDAPGSEDVDLAAELETAEAFEKQGRLNRRRPFRERDPVQDRGLSLRISCVFSKGTMPRKRHGSLISGATAM